MPTYTKQISKCYECPHYDHSGAFTSGGAYGLCGAVEGSKYEYYRRKLPYTYDEKTGKRVSTGKIPSWCPLEIV